MFCLPLLAKSNLMMRQDAALTWTSRWACCDCNVQRLTKLLFYSLSQLRLYVGLCMRMFSRRRLCASVGHNRRCWRQQSCWAALTYTVCMQPIGLWLLAAFSVETDQATSLGALKSKTTVRSSSNQQVILKWVTLDQVTYLLFLLRNIDSWSSAQCLQNSAPMQPCSLNFI